ncbi:MAG: MerR family transcriptional regulator [bacterium]|nr:MerR family transcriptional regulator [bacterium]
MSEKFYYSISEVSKTVNLHPYVLRYWEQEFRELRPKKTDGGRRAYTSKDIELILLIKELLYKDKYTIEGARMRLKEIKKGNNVSNLTNDVLKEIKSGLKDLLKILS